MVRLGIADAVERLEDGFEVLGLDADPLVRDADDDTVVAGLVPAADDDLAALGAVLDGVGEQVHEHLRELGAVSQHLRQQGTAVHDEVVHLGRRREDGHDAGDAVVDGDALHGHADVPGLDARDVQHVVQYLGEPQGLLRDVLEPPPLRAVLAGVVQQQVGEADDRGHRRAELVRGHGHEGIAAAVEVAVLGDVADQDADHPLVGRERDGEAAHGEVEALRPEHDEVYSRILRAAVHERLERLGRGSGVVEVGCPRVHQIAEGLSLDRAGRDGE